MKLKKVNAVLALLSTLALFLHMGYNAWSYLTFYYNPTLKNLTSWPLMVLTCAHAVCGMCTVFLMGDGTRMGAYGKLNKKTVIQRVTAALIFPLLIVHMNTFNLLQSSAVNGQWWLFAVLILVQLAFYAVITMHTAVSFSKALITLGMLGDINKQKAIDRVFGIICTALLLVTSFAVVKGQLAMFLPK